MKINLDKIRGYANQETAQRAADKAIPANMRYLFAINGNNRIVIVLIPNSDQIQDAIALACWTSLQAYACN